MTAAVCDPEVIEGPFPIDGIPISRIVAEPIVDIESSGMPFI